VVGSFAGEWLKLVDFSSYCSYLIGVFLLS
jgi:hypothetical protein